MDPIDLARTYLDRRTAVTVLASSGPSGVPDLCLLVAPQVTSDGLISGGEEASVGGRAFRNLRQNARAALLVLDPIMDPRARDGVRIEAEFLGAEEDGEELGHLTEWLNTFAPGRKIVRRLLFKILEVEPYRPRDVSPIFHHPS
ncbi:MAG: pyridoxamine 5'-phosphate oxidase family protein [Planctomycetota bacterium]